MNSQSSSAGFTALDTHFAALLGRLAVKPSVSLDIAAQLVSRWRAKGHLCVTLADLESNPPEELGSTVLPELEPWIGALRESGVVGVPGEFMPLILDPGSTRLYLRRYWSYEKTLADQILQRVTGSPPEIDPAKLDAGLERLFPPMADGAVDWQRVAASTATSGNFCVISGGPGTGKTRTVVSVLALLIEQGVTRLALAAPTGKAAARLKESLREGKAALGCDDEVKVLIPDDVTTLHRLLGARPDTAAFFRNRDNPLEVDAVVVDEASMVDVPLMAKLFDATPTDARIILLGDHNQLASVEAGHALGDICGPGDVEVSRPIAKAVVELRKNYRFQEDSGIGKLSEAVNAGDADGTLAILEEDGPGDVRWKALPKPGNLESQLRPIVLGGYRRYLEADAPAEALAHFNDLRILCAVHAGPAGVGNINRLVEAILQEEGLIDPRERNYAGRPVMVTRNNHSLKLYNGDIGLLLPDESAGGELRVFFASDGEVRRFLPSRLPPHETVFAMTVHKSQGSEFREVLLLLPRADSPVLTRELIYTGLTRARGSVELWGGEEVLRTAVNRRVERSSGLREALWGAPSSPGSAEASTS